MPEVVQPTGPCDRVIGHLHALRESSGQPTYAELTRRVIEQRMADGKNEHAARIAKSSVHDAFRYGRSRINEPLTRELIKAMGADPVLLDDWMADPVAPSPAPELPPEEVKPEILPPPISHRLALLIACVALNLFGREFVDFFHLPLYLDMVGTAIAAIACGPWKGAGVGLTTNLVGVIGSGWISLPFALTNIAGALVWGYGVRRGGMGRTLPRFFSLNLLAALVSSAVSVPILLIFVGRSFRDGHDLITQIVEQSVHNRLVAVSFSNLMTSVGDKLISGFVALVAVSALPMAFRQGFKLVVATDPAPRVD